MAHFGQINKASRTSMIFRTGHARSAATSKGASPPIISSHPLEALLHRFNPVLRGWAIYFRPGVSSSTFQYLSKYAWERVMGWLRRKHRKITWAELRRRFCAGGWWPVDGELALFDPGKVRTSRYRYRGTKIPTPWTPAS